MALKELITDLGSFYDNNPNAAKYKSKAGPSYVQSYGFNQRSLTFGDDRPANGSSKQPFIKTGLPPVDSDPTSATGLIAGITREIESRTDDLERISKFLITPKGLQFIAKQELLSTQNPIVPGRPNRSTPLKGFYNPLSTLAQVAASGTGLHIERQGLLPVFNSADKYEKTYLTLSKDDKGNRLENLYLTKVVKNKVSSRRLQRTGISTDPNLLLSYLGGSGISKTNIQFADNRVYGTSNTENRGGFTYTQRQLRNQKSKGANPTGQDIGPDFRSKIAIIPGNAEQKRTGLFGEIDTRDYLNPKVNKITRVGIGDPGKRTRNRSSLYLSDGDTIDKVAALPLYKGGVADLTSHSRDFIRFRFEVLDNENTQSATYVHFRAFLGAINDNYSGQWDTTQFVGRGDQFYNYKGFQRDISLSFTVHPQSREEMAAMYQKLTYLASTLAPDYSGDGGYMKGNITRLTVGSYFYRIPGFISSLSYTVPENASWEIAFDSPEKGFERDQMEVPRHFEVSVNFTPIHDFAPQLMDGTREYALFTPTQTNSGQPNRYLPPKGADLQFRDKFGDITETNYKDNIIQPNGKKANETVDRLGNGITTQKQIANQKANQREAVRLQEATLRAIENEEDGLEETGEEFFRQSLASQDNLGQGTPINFN